MEAYSQWQAIVTGVLAFAAIAVTLWSPESFYPKLIVAFLFLGLGTIAIWLQWQKDSADKSVQTQLLNWQRGDPKKPPYIGYSLDVNPTDKVLRNVTFVMTNDSDFPAYDVSGRLWDPESRDISAIEIASMQPHTARAVGQIGIDPSATSKTFAAQFVTRAGSFMEVIRMVKTDQSSWSFAFRVTGARSTNLQLKRDLLGNVTADLNQEVLIETINKGFPLNKDGKVDW